MKSVNIERVDYYAVHTERPTCTGCAFDEDKSQYCNSAYHETLCTPDRNNGGDVIWLKRMDALMFKLTGERT